MERTRTYRFIAVTVWWEDASVHRLVTLQSAYRAPEAYYYASGLSYGGPEGDRQWEAGTAPEVARLAGDFAYAVIDRAVSPERRSAAARALAEHTDRVLVTSPGLGAGPVAEWVWLPGLLAEAEEEAAVAD